MFATAAAIAAASRPRGAHAQGAAKKAAPSDRLRVAVIGVNGRGMSHVRAFSDRPDTEVAVICDVDDTTFERPRKLVESKTGKAPTFQKDLRRVLEDKSIDIVTIATPNHWHALAAIWAMQAGKDVYVEKPVATTSSRGAGWSSSPASTTRIVQTGTQSRSNPGDEAGHRVHPPGKLGKVCLARGLCYKRRETRSARSPAPACRPERRLRPLVRPGPDEAVRREKFHYDWHWFWDYGNGDIGNQGVHQMDIAPLGPAARPPLPDAVSSSAAGSATRTTARRRTRRSCVLRLRRRQLIFEVRGLPTEGLEGAKVGNIFHGSEGYVGAATATRSGTIFDLKGEKVISFSGDGDHFDNFIKAVRSRKHTDLTADIQEGHLSAALCHLGNVSYRLGKSLPLGKRPAEVAKIREAEESFGRFEKHLADSGVALDKTSFKLGAALTVDPKTETFTNGSRDANALLTRPARKGFSVPENA